LEGDRDRVEVVLGKPLPNFDGCAKREQVGVAKYNGIFGDREGFVVLLVAGTVFAV